MRPFDPRLIKYARETRSYIVFLVTLGFLQTLLIAAQIILIAQALSPIFYGTATLKDTALFIGGIGIVFLIRSGLEYVQHSFGHRAAIKVISQLRGAVLDHSSKLGVRWLSDGNTSRVVTLTTRGLDDLEAYFVSFLPQLFLCVTTIPALLVIILYLDWLSALAIILCIPLIPLFMILIGKLTSRYSSQRLKSMQQLGTQLLDLLAGLSTLKALGREKGPRKRVEALGNSFAEKTMQTLYVAFLSGAALEFLATLSTAIVAVEIGFRMVGGSILLFSGLAVIMLTPEVFKPLREVGTQFHASADGVAAAEQAFSILEKPLPSQDGTLPSPDLSLTPIVTENLSVFAPGRATVAPHQLNATFEPGKITVLRGISGSGKSTAVHVLLGLIEPNEGAVNVGNLPLNDLNLETYWSQITWVPQHPVILPGSILENLGVEGETPGEEVTKAAKQTGFSDVVALLPNGWNTLVGQGGVGMSVGQRQRLALTRALLDESSLVVLDEPSAHLDATSEEYVTDVVCTLKKQGKTVIVIAHRAALTKIADHIVEVTSSSRNIDTEVAQNLQAQRDSSVYSNMLKKIDYALPENWENEGNR
ncbi:thiol reductant ABC exporter subunit CydD [Arcanobacterium ihumii]|uniref:thiol reductant ABC exporter subunit CydD n=1 Tax=Arcanobacterium ihumii TaxID=2138162 RepID=UPI000F525AB4|nr:thiol reductant ABC exporter subunit CydD [Arcanobacterium ihumii]